MKKTTKILLIVAVMCLFLSSAVACVSAKPQKSDGQVVPYLFTQNDAELQPTDDEFFVFELLKDGTYSIRANRDKVLPQKLVLPSTHNGKQVTRIPIGGFGYGIFYDEEVGKKMESRYSQVKEIILPQSITVIENCAFFNSVGLEHIYLPEGLTYIGFNTFSGCTSLTSIEIPHSVTNIGNYAFYGCTGLADLTVGNGVETIGDFAFSGCTSLVNVSLGDGLKIIKDKAFYGCTSLKNVALGSSVERLKWDCFMKCRSLVSVSVPQSLTYIEIGVFSDCYNLTSIIYDGTIDDWHGNVKKYMPWLPELDSYYGTKPINFAIYCRDGEIRYRDGEIYYNENP